MANAQALQSSSRRPSGRRFFTFIKAFALWIGTLLLTLAGLLVVVFLLGQSSNADPALNRVGDHASEEVYQKARHDFGLDRPLPVQFFDYAGKILTGNFGTSWSSSRPIAGDLARVFPATLELSTVAIIFGASIGIALGIASVIRPNGWADNVLRFVSLFGYSVPIFWLGLLMLLLFYARLHWAVGPGRLDDLYQYSITPRTGFVLIDTLLAGDFAAFRNAVAHLVLPAAALAFQSVASISRLVRAALLAELSKDYVIAARAKGATQLQVIVGQALPNISGVVVIVVALAYTSLVEGAILTETVFAWPGIGRYMTLSIFAADIPAVLGGTLVIGTTFVTVNAIADLLVKMLDPRILK